MTFDEHMTAATAEHSLVAADRDRKAADLSACQADLSSCRTVNIALKKRVDELEAQLALSTTTSRTTTRRTTTRRTTTIPPTPVQRPHILDDSFLAKVDGNPLDWKRYFPDKTTTDKFVFLSPRNVQFKWRPSSDPDDMRAQIVQRLTYGGGGTPRRDPVGSLRLYAFGLWLPSSFSTTDQWSNQKCITGQFHQGGANGIVNPPVSFEQINGEMRCVLSLPGLIEGDRKNFPMGPCPRTRSDMLLSVKWSQGGDGRLQIWRDGVQKANYSGPTCWSMEKAGQGLNPILCTYNPGHKNGAYAGVPSAWNRDVVYTHWLIGDQGNVLADMVP